MPELPEVTTTVNGLREVLPGLRFVDVWTDLNKKDQQIKQFRDTIKNDTFFKKFKKLIVKQKVISVERRAKNILINISGGHTVLIHLRMTGHLLYGKYIMQRKQGVSTWVPDPKEKESLKDPYNRFIHLVFSLSNGRHLAFSDSRKFGKVTILKTVEIETSSHLKNIGPEPLSDKMTLQEFKKCLEKKPRLQIKTKLMDQSIIAGIGNIYSDEMLWIASIHPQSTYAEIPSSHTNSLYKAMKEVLSKGINMGGDSMSDYRNIDGLRGNFQHHHNVYQKKGECCKQKGCKGVIIRKVVNGRSAHFCNLHQKLFQ